MKKFTRLLSLLPFFIMFYIIFMLSAQDAEESGSLSYKVCCFILDTSKQLLSLEIPEARSEEIALSLQFFVRKGAHMTEYFILAFTIFLPLRVLFKTDVPLLFGKDMKKQEKSRAAWAACLREKLGMTLFFGVLCASLDEFHQTFVPGRAGLPADVLIDSIGICAACLLLWFCYRTSFFRRISFGG